MHDFRSKSRHGIEFGWPLLQSLHSRRFDGQAIEGIVIKSLSRDQEVISFLQPEACLGAKIQHLSIGSHNLHNDCGSEQFLLPAEWTVFCVVTWVACVLTIRNIRNKKCTLIAVESRTLTRSYLYANQKAVSGFRLFNRVGQLTNHFTLVLNGKGLPRRDMLMQSGVRIGGTAQLDYKQRDENPRDRHGGVDCLEDRLVLGYVAHEELPFIVIAFMNGVQETACNPFE